MFDAICTHNLRVMIEEIEYPVVACAKAPAHGFVTVKFQSAARERVRGKRLKALLYLSQRLLGKPAKFLLCLPFKLNGVGHNRPSPRNSLNTSR
jgi:hypothetical protein